MNGHISLAKLLFTKYDILYNICISIGTFWWAEYENIKIIFWKLFFNEEINEWKNLMLTYMFVFNYE